jgi:hypothetical protein
MSTDQTRLFVGYFSDQNKPRKIASFLSHHTPEVEKVWIISRLVRFNQKIYCCCVQYRSERQTHEAWRKLNQLEKHEKHLRVRPWVIRTGANERRDIGWRSKVWSTDERRSRERRDFQSLVYRYDQFRNKTAYGGKIQHSFAKMQDFDNSYIIDPPPLPNIKISFISEQKLPRKYRNYFSALLGGR